MLPAPSSFPSLAVFTQHVLTSRTTPPLVKQTLTSARSLLGPDAYELLISHLSAAALPTAADISAALAEVRPFAVEHERERNKAKLRLVQAKRSQQGDAQQSDQLQPQLDERAMLQLQRALVSIAKYINPTATPPASSAAATGGTESNKAKGSGAITPPPAVKSQPAPSASPPPTFPAKSGRPPQKGAAVQPQLVSPTRQLLTRLANTLPPLHYQALLRCFLVHATTPPSNRTLHERQLTTVRDVVAAAQLQDDTTWQSLYRQYKALRRREALDEAVCADLIQPVDEAELSAVLPQAAEIERQVAERKRRLRQHGDAAERKEADKRENVRESHAAAEQERGRLIGITGRATSLSLPEPLPLPAFYPASPIPIAATSLSASLLPPSKWTLAAMRCLEQVQSQCHPLTYWHFRSYMTQLAAGPAAELAAATSASAVFAAVRSYCALLFPQPQLVSLISTNLPTFLSIDAPPLRLSGRPGRARLSPTVASLSSIPTFDLPLERHVFLCHLHREVVPVQSSELFLAWWRWQLSAEEMQRSKERADEGPDAAPAGAAAVEEVDEEASEEMKTLDEEISRMNKRKRRRRKQGGDSNEEAEEDAPTEEKKAAERKPRRDAHSRASVFNAAARLFGDSSPLVFLLRQHNDALTHAEWSEVRLRLSPESEHHDYIGFFFVDDSSSAGAAAQPPYHQRYNNPLLESNPALVFVHSPTPPSAPSPASPPSASLLPPLPAALSSAIAAFSSFRAARHAHKLFLSNVPPDLSARELQFALRRIGAVQGGELFREKQRLGSTEREMIAEKDKRDKAANAHTAPVARGRKATPLNKVLKMSGASPVYACVYFESAAALEAAAEPSLHLFGLQYRGRSMYPMPASTVTRITLASPTLRHSFSFSNLVQHIVQLLVPAVLPSALHVSVNSRSSLANNGSVTLTLRTHEEAVRAWERLRAELFAGRRVRCSWTWEERDKLLGSTAKEQEDSNAAVRTVEQNRYAGNVRTRNDGRPVQEAEVTFESIRQRAGESS